MAERWQQGTPVGQTQSSERFRSGQIVVDPYKASEESRKQQDQSFEAERLRLAQEAEARQNAALSAQITNMNKPPAGYSRNADGTLSPIPGGPADPSIASGRLTANQRVDLENKRGTLRNLASGVTSLRQQYNENFKGKNPAEYLPVVARPANGVFNDTSGSLSAYVAAALGLSGQQFNTPAEQQLFIGSILPKSGDTDAQIENKLGRLEELLNNADHTSANLLGIEPGIFGEKLVGEGDGSPGPDSGEPPMPTPNIGPSAGTPDIGGDVREFSTEYDRRYAAEVQQAFNQGATRQQLDAIAAKYSAPSFGPDLDQAIRARDAGAQSIQFSTPVSGRESTGLTGELLGGAAATPFGAYGINAANALTAGTLDEIVGATGGNAQAAQLAKDLASEQNPGASILGNITGGEMGMLAASSGVGAIPGIGARLAAAGGGIVPDLLYGAAYGAGEAGPGERLSGAAQGAALSGAGNVVGRALLGGTGRAIRGVSDPAVRYLQSKGVPLTLGQMTGQGGVVGRTIQGIEDKLESVPLLGDAIRQRRQEGYEAFNQAAFRDALEPINAQVQGTVGGDAIEQAQDAVSQYYGDTLSGVRLARTPAFDESVDSALAAGSAVPGMGDDVGYSVARALANFGEDGGMTGRGFQTAVSDLRKDAKGLIRKDSLRGYDAANSLRSVEEALLATAREQAPGTAEALQAGNRAYGNVSVLEDAVLKALNGADGPGIFTPAQLGQAARANAKKFGGKKAAARGEIPFSELQSNAQAVLPSTVPNSGTTDRAIAAWLLPTALGGAAATGVATDYVPEEAAIPIGLLGLSSTKAGREALEKLLLGRSETARSIGNKVYDNRAIGGNILAPLLLGIGSQ